MNLLNINKSESVGDSLSSINISFEVLDSAIQNLNYNIDKYLIPYVNFFKASETSINFLFDVYYDKKPNWDYMSTVVQTNSSKWIKPIVYIDSNIYRFPDSNLNKTVNAIVENFKSIYPIFNSTEQKIPNYIQNQKAVIYYYVNHVYNNINIEDTVNSDVANCVSQGTKKAILNCQNKIGIDKTYCNGAEISCNGCEGGPCQQEISVTCLYPETKKTTTNRYIQAIIKSNFEDIAEKEIKTIFLTVKNCDWEIERIL